MRVSLKLKAGSLTSPFQHPGKAGGGEWGASLRRKHERRFGVLVTLQLAKGAGFIASDGMRGRRAPLGPSDGHGGGGEVNLIPAQVHQLGRSEAVSEGHEDHAGVTVTIGVMKRDFFHGGEVLLNDKPVRYRVPAPAVKAGIAYVTEDRKVEGFFETASIARNIYLGLLAKFPRGRALLPRREANVVGKSWIERLKVRAISHEVRVVELSGGNQQKVVIALIQGPDLIIFDEPTRGVDVGAIVEIHKSINRLADEGKAVVVISSYLPEILALSDRILVSRGKVVEEFSALEATEEKIMYAAIH